MANILELSDRYGRVATDLRVSLTDRCNLRCSYCMPAEGLDWLPTPQVLTDDEVNRLLRISVEMLGVTKLRFTDLSHLQPQLAAFNGRPFQYAAHPLVVSTHDRVRMWVLNARPNVPLAFHIVGTQFDTSWQEGHYSVYRGQSTDGITEGETGAQVLSLLAVEGGFVEFEPWEPGHYTMVNHVMSLAEKGAYGVLRVE